jgi:hypothetical protein
VKRVFATILTLLAAGCVTWQEDDREDRAVNKAPIEEYTHRAVENGIVVQHTLYPHHFVPGSARLTVVGERDLQVLARHYGEQPGPLNLPRQGVPEDLYRAREQAVRQALVDRGVDVSRMTIVDAFPGGPGMSSQEVLRALEPESDGEAAESRAPRPARPRRDMPRSQMESSPDAQ